MASKVNKQKWRNDWGVTKTINDHKERRLGHAKQNTGCEGACISSFTAISGQLWMIYNTNFIFMKFSDVNDPTTLAYTMKLFSKALPFYMTKVPH